MGWREELSQMGQGFADAATLPSRFTQQLGNGLNNLAINTWNNPREVAGEMWDAYSKTSPGLNIPGGGVPGSITSGIRAVVPGLGRLQSVGSKMAGQFGGGVKNAIIDKRSDMDTLTGLKEKFPEKVKAMQDSPISVLWKWGKTMEDDNAWATTTAAQEASKRVSRGKLSDWRVDPTKLEEITKRQAAMRELAENQGSPVLKKMVDEMESPISVTIDPRGPADSIIYHTPHHEADHVLEMMAGNHGLVPTEKAQATYFQLMKDAGHDLDYIDKVWRMYNKPGQGGVGHAAVEAASDLAMKQKGIPFPKRKFPEDY